MFRTKIVVSMLCLAMLLFVVYEHIWYIKMDSSGNVAILRYDNQSCASTILNRSDEAQICNIHDHGKLELLPREKVRVRFPACETHAPSLDCQSSGLSAKPR